VALVARGSGQAEAKSQRLQLKLQEDIQRHLISVFHFYLVARQNDSHVWQAKRIHSTVSETKSDISLSDAH
jgi:hypothetical protein